MGCGVRNNGAGVCCTSGGLNGAKRVVKEQCDAKMAC